MPLPDDAPEKWELKEHTKVKHEILEKYLTPWIYHLGRNPRIAVFDCFAGRGEYSMGEPGSPLRILRKFGERKDYYQKAHCIFIEKNKNNFQNLEKVIDRELQENPDKYEKVEIIKYNDTFADVVSEILSGVKTRLVPSLFFIDPFGFKGVPFELIKEIMKFPRVEIFFTFMSKDMNRFLGSEKHSDALDELFGTGKWREILEESEEGKQQHELRELYRNQLHKEANVKYSWTYKVGMDETRQTTYYLIHATNNFKGLKIVKDIMYKQSPVEGRFGYLGPDEYQGDLSDFIGGRLNNFKDFLLATFRGKTLSFLNIIEKSYMETSFIEKDYRKALKELEKEGKISVRRITSKTEKGLGGEDEIAFPDI